jgi:hypothetical protein
LIPKGNSLIQTYKGSIKNPYVNPLRATLFGRTANERVSVILESLLQNSKGKINCIFLTKIRWWRHISIGVGMFLDILRLRFF